MSCKESFEISWEMDNVRWGWICICMLVRAVCHPSCRKPVVIPINIWYNQPLIDWSNINHSPTLVFETIHLARWRWANIDKGWYGHTLANWRWATVGPPYCPYHSDILHGRWANAGPMLAQSCSAWDWANVRRLARHWLMLRQLWTNVGQCFWRWPTSQK